MQCCSLVVAKGGMGLFLANSCGSALLFRVKKNWHIGNEGSDSKIISPFSMWAPFLSADNNILER